MEVTFDEKNTKILCEFKNQDADTSDEQCSIVYVDCQQQSIPGGKQFNTTNNVADGLQFPLEFSSGDQATYCYVVTASNATYTVIVEGSITFGKLYYT